MIKLYPPNGENKILLHTCCAPCSSAIIESLLANNIKPVIFYYNPNIFPQEEYQLRKEECIRYTKKLNLDFIDADYNYIEWRKNMMGLENEAERGSRCLKCFIMRLTETARYASINNLSVFTTTLASSRWKSLEQITEAGQIAASQFTNLYFWEQNWRKGGLNERRAEIIKEYNFYKQQYCGCEFSQRNKETKQNHI